MPTCSTTECRFGEAAETIAQVEAEHDRTGELGALESSDVPEMEWTRGLFLMAAGRFPEAIPVLDACARHGGPHRADSQGLAVLGLVRCNRLSEAGRRIKNLPRSRLDDALANTIRIELYTRLSIRTAEGD